MYPWDIYVKHQFIHQFVLSSSDLDWFFVYFFYAKMHLIKSYFFWIIYQYYSSNWVLFFIFLRNLNNDRYVYGGLIPLPIKTTLFLTYIIKSVKRLCKRWINQKKKKEQENQKQKKVSKRLFSTHQLKVFFFCFLLPFICHLLKIKKSVDWHWINKKKN